MIEEDSPLTVAAAVIDDKPFVQVGFHDLVVDLSIIAATQKAVSIIRAASYLEMDRLLYEELEGADAMKLLIKTIRKKRQALPDDIELNINTQEKKPFIILDLVEFKLTLYIDEALFLATSIMNVAEAARNDAFFITFGKKKQIPLEDIYQVLYEYKEYKQRRSIEEMLNI